MKKHLFLALAVAVLFLMNIFFGSVHIAFSDVMSSLLGRNSDTMVNFIVVDSRLPQTVTALLVGASLAVAGLLLQTALHNPLAGPSVLGISGGASFGVALVTLGASWLGLPFLKSGIPVTVVALAGALAVTFLLLILNSLLRNNLVLLVAGLLLGYLISGIITILNVVATAENLQSYIMWGMGDFSSVSLSQLPFLSVALVILIALSVMMTKPLNAIMLGDQYAENLGVNIRRTRNVLLLIVGCITALTTAYCGPVAFIGLAVPHVARMVVRTDNFLPLIPMTLLCGAAVALLCNVISTVPTSTVLPINAVTPIIGVPVILYVIIRRK
jgi:iron complex transport system permease protein